MQGSDLPKPGPQLCPALLFGLDRAARLGAGPGGRAGAAGRTPRRRPVGGSGRGEQEEDVHGLTIPPRVARSGVGNWGHTKRRRL